MWLQSFFDSVKSEQPSALAVADDIDDMDEADGWGDDDDDDLGGDEGLHPNRAAVVMVVVCARVCLVSRWARGGGILLK